MPLIFKPEDEIPPSPKENLYGFLYNLKIVDRLSEYYEMFNHDISLDGLVKPNKVALEPLQREYEDKFSNRCVVVDGVRYLHFSEFGVDRALRRKLQRAVDKLPNIAMKEDTDCPLHPIEKCKLVSLEYGFLCFLHSITKDETGIAIEASTSRNAEGDVDAEEEVHEEVRSIDVEQESIDADQQIFPATSSLDDIPDQGESLDTVEDNVQRNCELALPQLPYFSMDDGFDYVLMSDVTNHFNIREDYCLAALAQYCEADNDFVENICDKYLLIDTDCDEAKYQGGRVILQRILNEARVYEQTLPSEEEFQATLCRLGLENMGKETSAPSPSDIEEATSSVPLWTPTLLEDDENQLIYVEEDDFLKRASGTRASGSSSSSIAYRKDAALKEYLQYLDHKKIMIFHKDFSKEATKFPLFALKVLTKFCGGYEVPQNADRIVMIERQFALRVFGQGLYCQALRSPYYIAYAAQALILGIADAEQLPIYGKRFLMRNRKQRIAPYMLPLPPPLLPQQLSAPAAPRLQFEEESEDVEQRPQKRLKPTSSPP